MIEDIILELKKLETDWEIEKEREHLKDPLKRGKDILRKLDNTIIELLLKFEEKDKEKVQEIKEILEELRELEEYQLYVDGGKSFDEFWTKGSSLFRKLHSIIEF